MEVKLQGFYSTVIRFIETYNEKIDQCVNLVSQIQEHEKQLQSCENVNPLDFKIDSINFKIKASLLQKLQDILSQKNFDLTVLVSNFQTNSNLLKKKLEKCIEVKFRPKKENVELGQFFSWAFEICDIFEKHALKCEYLLENRHQLEYTMDAENDKIIDESDHIFGHEISKQVWSGNFDLPFEDREKLNCKFKKIFINCTVL